MKKKTKMPDKLTCKRCFYPATVYFDHDIKANVVFCPQCSLKILLRDYRNFTN